MGKTRMYEPYGYNEGEAYYSIRNTIDDEIKINRKIDKKQTDESFTNVSYDTELETVLFKNANGDIVGQLPMTDIMASALVKEAKYDKDTQKIIIEFDNGDVVSVDLNDIINIQEAGDGLILDDNKFAILIDPESEEFLQVSANGIKNVGIQAAINVERDRAISAETKETNDRIADVNEEETRAKEEENILRQLITLEENRAKGEEQRIDNTLGTAFTTSATETVTAKYAYLNQKVEDEVSDRITAVADEKRDREDADVLLKTELLGLINTKANSNSVYNKSEVWTKQESDARYLNGGGEVVVSGITGVTFNGAAAPVNNNVAAITATIPSSLSDLSNTAHTHTTGDVTNLQEVLNDYATKSEVDTKDSNTLNDVLNRIWSDKNHNSGATGYFKTKYEHANGSYALLFNESDGGGSQYFNNDANIISYVGTNDGGTGTSSVCVQIYSKDKTTNVGSRLNVNPNGIYYKPNSNQQPTVDDEIATKADINALLQEIQTLKDRITALGG